MSDEHPNEHVEIEVLRDNAQKRLSTSERRKIERLVRDNLLLKSKEPYRKVQVEVKRGPDGTPAALVASMLRAHTYKADLVKVNVDANFHATAVEALSPGS
jgi:hypothetical protein